MRAGDLRRRIAIQVRSGSVDSYGQQLTSWSDLLASVPADIQPLSGRELVAAQAIQAEVTHEITVRYHAQLAVPSQVAGMRALYGSRIFDIKAAMNVDERNRQITLLATEGLTQG